MGKMRIRKRQQYRTLIVESERVRLINSAQGAYLYYEAKEDDERNDFVSMSENHTFRCPRFHEVVEKQVQMGEITHTEKHLYTKMLVFQNQHDPEESRVPALALSHGLYVKYPNGTIKHFKRVLRSSSQYRTAKMLMAWTEIVQDVREHATHGWVKKLEGKTLIPAKVEPYISLSLTSSLSAGNGWTFTYIEDHKALVNIEGAVCTDAKNNMLRYDEYLKTNDPDQLIMQDDKPHVKMELTDGQALMSPMASIKVAFRIGQITKRQYKLLLTAFTYGVSMSDQLANDDLAQIWDQISRAFQFRFGLNKGLAVIDDHHYVDSQGKQCDFVFPDGANKGYVERKGFVANTSIDPIHGDAHPKQIELAIANVAPIEEKQWGKLNYQFIQATTMQYEDLKALGDLAIKKVIKALESPAHAMAFIGMIDNGDEEDYEENNLTTKLRELLSASPNVFNTRWVQNKIKYLMEKSIMDIRFGRIPIEDSRFAFIVTDPTVLKQDKGLLGPGEYYYNGKTFKHAIFRSPLVHKSEPVVIDCVSRPELDEAFGHLNNILVLNAYDDTLPRMGGADTDGDKVFLTSEPVIINAIESLPMIYGDTVNAKPRTYLWENDGEKAIRQYDIDTFVPSDIGKVTNYATAHADEARDPRTPEGRQQELWNLITVARDVQGKVIDSAKTGSKISIPDRLKVNKYPHWLRDTEYKDIEGAEKVYYSQAPMGKLYDYITYSVKQRLTEFFSGIKEYVPEVLNGVIYDEVKVNDLLPHIHKLEQRYRYDMASVFNTFPDLKDSDFDNKEALKKYYQIRGEQVRAVVTRHRHILDSLDASSVDIAVACMHISEFDEKRKRTKSNSYPFSVATDYLITALKHAPNNFKLVRAYQVDEDLWADKLEVVNNAIHAGEHRVALVTLPDGMYETFTHAGHYFIKDPIEVNTVQLPSTKEKSKALQFNIKGFKHYNFSPAQVVEMIDQKVIKVRAYENQSGEWLTVFVDNIKVGTVGKESWITMNMMRNKELQVRAIHTYKKTNGTYQSFMKIDADVLGDAEFATEYESEEIPVYTYEDVPFDVSI